MRHAEDKADISPNFTKNSSENEKILFFLKDFIKKLVNTPHVKKDIKNNKDQFVADLIHKFNLYEELDIKHDNRM